MPADSCYTPKRFKYYISYGQNLFGEEIYVVYDEVEDVFFNVNKRGARSTVNHGLRTRELSTPPSSDWWGEVPADRIVELGVGLYEG
jgi:hypothetical protein